MFKSTVGWYSYSILNWKIETPMNKLNVWQNLVPFISYKKETNIFLLYLDYIKNRDQTTKMNGTDSYALPLGLLL